MMKTLAIIPAAGLGRRMGNIKKQFLKINETPIITITLRQFEACSKISAIIPVVGEEDMAYFKEQVIGGNRFSKITQVVTGGKERQTSVGNALKVASGFDIIVVHDGVRPFVSLDLINTAVEQAEKYGAVVTAIPSADTLKEVNEEGNVVRTLDRNSIFRIQTPQAFRADILKSAYKEATQKGITANDEASLVELLGHTVRIIPGTEKNIKITTKDDLRFFDSASLNKVVV